MCGITGYIGSKKAVPILLEGLQKLEYRGYDSAGVAVYNDGEIHVVKQKGRISELEAELAKQPLSGTIGIGHTRWATHGEPSQVNSHPHMGSNSRIALVHNGIIENYATIKSHLESLGISFASDTDTEVAAQLAEHYYDGDLFETVVKVLHEVRGSYALGFMCIDHPDTLIAVKKNNPLIVGVSEHGSFIASDIPALLKYTNKVYYLDDDEIAVLKSDGVQFFNANKEPIEKKLEVISWTGEAAEKGGYQHFMLKEIMEQPAVLKSTIQSLLTKDNFASGTDLDNINISDYERVCIIGCGSAYNVAMSAKYIFESLCRLPVDVDLASEFRYRDPLINEKTLVLLISQSGETADTIAAMREAKRKGSKTLSIVNVLGSTIAKESDFTLYTLAGPEIAVATTKALSTQLAVVYAIAIKFAAQLSLINESERTQLIAEVHAIPEKVEGLLEDRESIERFASTCIGYNSIFFIGRNIDYAVSLEGSLKLKEISYIHSEAYAGGELKHGTISLIEDNTLVVSISTNETLAEKINSNIVQVLSRGAKVLQIGNTQGVVHEKATDCKIPSIHNYFSPSLSVVVLQLFSYYVAANKGLDIDKPRNLAKSVTVE